MPDPQVNDWVFGFWGKLPSRGDFLGIGLSKALIQAWDSWISACLAASQAAMGADWQPAWMEAPVWCFSAAGGCFGTDPVSGLWMPSVDRAGRMFPLLFAAQGSVAASWYLQAEDAGRAALAELLGPESLAGRLPPPMAAPPTGAGTSWWTEGGPRVAACRRSFAGLPPPDNFISMLKDF